jgi:hypothetical protein
MFSGSREQNGCTAQKAEQVQQDTHLRTVPFS